MNYAELAGKTLEGYVCGTVRYADGEEQEYETKVSITFAKENKSVKIYKADNVVLKGENPLSSFTDAEVVYEAEVP